MNEILFHLAELAAFVFPGVVAVAGFPRACLAILLACWLGHALGGTSAYKAWKARARVF